MDSMGLRHVQTAVLLQQPVVEGFSGTKHNLITHSNSSCPFSTMACWLADQAHAAAVETAIFHLLRISRVNCVHAGYLALVGRLSYLTCYRGFEV
jgi:hypothetical protein